MDCSVAEFLSATRSGSDPSARAAQCPAPAAAGGGAEPRAISWQAVLRRTPRGETAISTRHSSLDPRSQAVLSLINGLRTVAEYHDLLPRVRDLDATIATLVGQGLVAVRGH